MSFENFAKKAANPTEHPKELTPEQAETHKIMDNIAGMRRRSAERSAPGGKLTSPELESPTIESTKSAPESVLENTAEAPKTIEYTPSPEVRDKEVASLSAVKERLGIVSGLEKPTVQSLEKEEMTFDARTLFNEAIHAFLRPGVLNPGQAAAAELMARNDEDKTISPEEREKREEAILDEWERYENGRGNIDKTNIERQNGSLR
jgi:hypothetical protein